MSDAVLITLIVAVAVVFLGFLAHLSFSEWIDFKEATHERH